MPVISESEAILAHTKQKTMEVIDPSVLSNPHSSQNHDVESAPIGSQSNHSRITLNDLKKILQQDKNTSEVTVEQIRRVKMMHDKFYEGTVFNFNYNTLLLVASVIAALGLVSDSTATVIASMLGENLLWFSIRISQ